MKKDLLSYKMHDQGYKTEFGVVESKKRLKQYDKRNIFKKNGFKKAVSTTLNIKTHVDIGSGTGWLLIKTSPYFKKVIGIEPSQTAIEIAQEIIKDTNNITYICADMIEGFQRINKNEQTFFTSSIVFSHIKNSYVKEALALLNYFPEGSMLYFDEPYELNISQRLWYVRSKEWWAKHLYNWDLEFYNIHHGKYTRGIYGVLKGKDNVQNTHKKSLMEKILWNLSPFKHQTLRVWRHVIKHFKK